MSTKSDPQNYLKGSSPEQAENKHISRINKDIQVDRASLNAQKARELQQNVTRTNTEYFKN